MQYTARVSFGFLSSYWNMNAVVSQPYWILVTSEVSYNALVHIKSLLFSLNVNGMRGNGHCHPHVREKLPKLLTELPMPALSLQSRSFNTL